ncbi:TonB-dependent receptor [Arsenicibacter rosenii]|uniref:TonB-dependent receptor plug domain-containing protein n=1 Tax=Arsenicibacter rosenii TaxID=1750698 RepID=A0A1S2VFQ0_9BACT|nr:TonB-dependent receptor plug domain-containing protein [Arsenicibacter rosenii]OIN57250.1 hypothetical protein BLX24_21090 [Arsenicibacter rosenii]
MRRWLLLLPILLIPHLLPAQAITISGFVRDSLSGENLSGAVVQIGNSTRQTNGYGFFSLRVAKSTASRTLSTHFLGYQTHHQRLAPAKDTTLTIWLTVQAKQLEAVTVQSDLLQRDVAPGTYRLPLTLLRQAPALLGEADLLKFVQTLPGVQGGTEGTAGMYVRGGSPDQNLILLDGMPVYNASHLFGFFSVFNPEAIATADFYKGAIPARYSGRLSSVLDLSMKEGNRQKTHGRFALSPVAGNLLLEGPLVKNKLSYMISGRRTWLDAFTNLLSLINNRNRLGYHFDDINAKINAELSPKRHLYVSWYRSKDRFLNVFTDSRYKSVYGYDWANSTLSARYTQLFSEKLFGRFQLGLVKYHYALNTRSETAEGTIHFDTRSAIRDVLLKTDFDLSAASSVQLQFGTQLSLRRFTPEIRTAQGNVPVDESAAPAQPAYSHEASAYVDATLTFAEHMSANVGLVQSVNLVPDRTYANLQPRLSIQYGLSDHLSLKAAYNTQVQYLHLLTNSSLGLPTDLWVPTNAAILPQTSQQVSLGIYQGNRKGFSGSVEGYYKWLDNVLEYKTGSNLFLTRASEWTDRVLVGAGRSYGLETYLKKTTGAWTGWVSYTLSWHQRLFAGLNGGQWFPYTYDRRHVVSAVVTKTTRPNQQLTANFQFNTGATATLPTSRVSLPQPDAGISPIYQGSFQQYFSQIDVLNNRNNFRLPAYHRLDLSYRFDKVKKRGTRSWILACYNVYNRNNPFIVYLQDGQLKQFSLFTILPSATYSYAF